MDIGFNENIKCYCAARLIGGFNLKWMFLKLRFYEYIK